MKKLIFAFIFLLGAGNIYSQAGSISRFHDSLLFDGQSKQLAPGSYVCNPDTTCVIVVYSLTGTAEGTVIWYTMEDFSVCGETDIGKVWHCEKRKLKIGDRLFPGEVVTTSANANLEVRVHYPKGTGQYFETSYSEKGVHRTDRVRYGNNTTCVPGCLTKMQRGMIWMQESKDEVDKKINEAKDNFIETVKSKVWPKGTEYTIEATDDADIIKVYEGSVEVELKKFDDTEIKNNSEEMKKLQEDYQSGKITMDEFMARAKELAEKVKQDSKSIMMKVTVEAGYQVTASGKLSEVTPISGDDIKWWSDENFAK